MPASLKLSYNKTEFCFASMVKMKGLFEGKSSNAVTMGKLGHSGQREKEVGTQDKARPSLQQHLRI